MTIISDMTWPVAVLERTATAIYCVRPASNLVIAETALRAALQAMCDCGMAIETTIGRWQFEGPDYPDLTYEELLVKPNSVSVLAIRLDADERKR